MKALAVDVRCGDWFFENFAKFFMMRLVHSKYARLIRALLLCKQSQLLAPSVVPGWYQAVV